MKGLTSNELRLVEEYLWVLDYVSRCALGVDRADWFYLYDKASELQRAAGQLVEVAQHTYQASTQGRGPRPEAVRAAVGWHGRTTAPAGCCTQLSPGGGGDRPTGAAPSYPRWWAGRPGRGHGPGLPGRPACHGAAQPGHGRSAEGRRAQRFW
jgi:hypothetical protein